MALSGLRPGWGPMVVSCRAPLGVAVDLPGLDLAGVLSGRVVRVMEADGERPLSKEYGVDLPLASCVVGEAGWHWAASCVIPDPVGLGVVGHRRRVRVLDMSWLGRTASRPWPILMAAKGAYKDRMTPYEVQGAGVLSWRAVGDPDAVRALLEPVIALGKARGAGEGMVDSWAVGRVDVPEGEWEAWVHADEDGRLLRPVPVECAAAWAAEGSWEVGFYGLRPPVRAHMADLAVPVEADGEQWEEDPWLA